MPDIHTLSLHTTPPPPLPGVRFPLEQAADAIRELNSPQRGGKPFLEG